MYQFGPFQLDPATVRLMKNGHEVEIEPQLFNALLLLIENNQRVVTKEELLDVIWQGRVVSDHVITRTIYELRKIIDVESDQNSKLRTVRGKGYQFIADLSPSEDQDPVSKNPGLIDKKHQLKTSKFMLGFMLILVVVVISFLWVEYFSQTVNKAGKPTTETGQTLFPIVTVLPVDVEVGNDEQSMLVHSLIEYLTHQLAVNLNMKVIHPDSLLNMTDRLDDVWAIQKATRSNFIIQGFVQSVSDQSINLHLSLYKKNIDGELTPFTLGAFELSYPKDAKTLNSLYKERKITVRSIIEIIKPGVTLSDKGEYETADPEAYRMVIAAHHISRNDGCEDLSRAETLLLKAVQRDENFAYAFYQLFANYFKRVWLCGASKEYHEKAMSMAEIVERLAPGVYSPMYKGMNHILIASNRVEEAYEISKDFSWNDADALNHKVYGLRYAGFLNLANSHIDRILQLDPLFYSEKPINQAPNTLLYLNRFSEYMSLLSEPGNSYHDYYRGLSLALFNQPKESIKVLQGVIDRQSSDLFGQLSKALLLILADENAAAVDIIDSLVLNRVEKKHSDGEMTYKLVQLYALANATEQALENLQVAVNQGFFPMNYFMQDPALKSIQNTADFSAIVKQATERHLAFADRFALQSEVNR